MHDPSHSAWRANGVMIAARRAQGAVGLLLALWLVFLSTAGAAHRVLPAEAGGGDSIAVMCAVAAQQLGADEGEPAEAAPMFCPLCSATQSLDVGIASHYQVDPIDCAFDPAIKRRADAHGTATRHDALARAPPTVL